MKPLAEIVDVYYEPLSEASVIGIGYDIDREVQSKIMAAKDEIQTVVEQKRCALGFEQTRPINLSAENALLLRAEIKAEPAWAESTKNIIRNLLPGYQEADMEFYLNLISIPWWNSSLLFRADDRYNTHTNSLDIAARLSHSYISQLKRAGKAFGAAEDSMSISNVLLTADNLLVLGWRGGHTFSDTLMTVPAGSIEYHTGKNPLFETLYAEMFEETGMTKESLSSAELIGKIFDNTLGNISLFVFRSRTHLSFSELLSLWGSSMDNREHKYLIPLQDNPQNVLEHLRNNRYNPACLSPEGTSVTGRKNIGSILPPCAASLLLHYTQREGRRWGAKAEEMLNRDYAFR